MFQVVEITEARDVKLCRAIQQMRLKCAFNIEVATSIFLGEGNKDCMLADLIENAQDKHERPALDEAYILKEIKELDLISQLYGLKQHGELQLKQYRVMLYMIRNEVPIEELTFVGLRRWKGKNRNEVHPYAAGFKSDDWRTLFELSD